MGKPFTQEILQLKSTSSWSLELDIGPLCRFVRDTQGTPLLSVGSGGSLTAAHMAALLHQATGDIGKALTPLELVSAKDCVHRTSVLILTAGGSNNDTLSAF